MSIGNKWRQFLEIPVLFETKLKNLNLSSKLWILKQRKSTFVKFITSAR